MLLCANAALEENKQRINELNVFPVPDGDTGTNMSLTMNSAAIELGRKQTDTVGAVADCAASALLRGARGNSGVILSLLFRGIAKSLKGRENANAAEFATGGDGGGDGGADLSHKGVGRQQADGPHDEIGPAGVPAGGVFSGGPFVGSCLEHGGGGHGVGPHPPYLNGRAQPGLQTGHQTGPQSAALAVNDNNTHRLQLLSNFRLRGAEVSGENVPGRFDLLLLYRNGGSGARGSRPERKRIRNTCCVS